MNKIIFRVGDTAKVVVPKIVKRVGYPKGISDYEKEVEEKFGPEVSAIFAKAGIMDTPLYSATKAKVSHELAYMLAKLNHFGGRKRSVHLEERPEILGQKFFIHSLKTFMEGTYFPGFGGSWENSYDDGEGPSLSISRAVRVAYGYVDGGVSLLLSSSTDMIRIPIENLEKMT